MKVLHICADDFRGAGIAARRIHLGLKSEGIESRLLMLQNNSEDEGIIRYVSERNIVGKIVNKIRRRRIYSEFDFYKNTRPYGLELFSDDRSVCSVSKSPLLKDADIIHLHWVRSLVDYTDFFFNYSNKTIIWTLHDMNPFTGGCHYAMGCERYKTGCGNCHQLGSDDPFDLSERIFRRKERCYARNNIHLIAPSKWLRDLAQGSYLFQNFAVDVIPYGVSTTRFTNRDKRYSRDLLGLPHDKTLILFRMEGENSRKGLNYLKEACKFLKGKIDASKIALVNFGADVPADDFSAETGLRVYSVGYVQDETLLSCVYNSADIYVMCSTEDNFPNTVLESMACGIPVISFKAGGIPEIIESGKTGLLAEVKNIMELSEKLMWAIVNPNERGKLGLEARRRVEQKYGLRIQAKSYIDLYQSLLEGRPGFCGSKIRP